MPPSPKVDDIKKGIEDQGHTVETYETSRNKATGPSHALCRTKIQKQ